MMYFKFQMIRLVSGANKIIKELVMLKILIPLISIFPMISYADKVDFSQKQADLTVACGNYDLSNLWGIAFLAKGSDDTVMIKERRSVLDDSNRPSKTIFAMKLRKDGSCKKMSRAAMIFLQTGENFTEANDNLFKCPKEIWAIKSAQLFVGEPSISEKREGGDDYLAVTNRVSSYPIVNSEGKQVKTLIIRDAWQHGVLDDNDWNLESCSIK